MHSLEDGAFVTNVARRRKTQTANQASAHVGQNVTVKVGHDQDLVVIRDRVRHHLQAGVIEKLIVELDAREVLGDLTTDVEEKTVRHLHDGGLVYDSNLGTANGLCLLEGKSEDAFRGIASDELDGLDNSVDNDVLDAGIFALGVFSDQNSVDVVVRGFETSDRSAWSQVGEEVKGSAKSEVERHVALSNGGLRSKLLDMLLNAHNQRVFCVTVTTYGQRALEGHLVLLDVCDRGIGNSRLSVLENGGDVA